jgi:hypothetical protein
LNDQTADVCIDDANANEGRLRGYGFGLTAWTRYRQHVVAGRNESNSKATFRISPTGTLRPTEQGPIGVECQQRASNSAARFVDRDAGYFEGRRRNYLKVKASYSLRRSDCDGLCLGNAT